MDVYPNELNVNLSGCSSATVKTITVENIGTEDLSYSMYGSLIDPLSTGEVIESYGSFSSGSWGAELVDGFLYTTNNYNGTIEKYDLEKQTIVSSFSVISSPLHIAYFDDCFWVSQYGSKTIYCYDINGNKIDKTIIAPVSNPLITSDGTSLYVAPYNTGSTTYIQT